MYKEEIDAGQEYQELTPCYGIHFLVSDLFPDEAEWLNLYKMLNVKNYKLLSEQWQLYFVELEKFDRTKKENKASWKLLEQWCDFILRPRDPQKPLDKHLKNNPAIQEV